MNIIFWIILIALVIDFAIGLVSTILNLRSLQTKPPETLADIYDDTEYKTSQEYTLAQSKFGLLTGSIKLVLLLVFWFAGGFNYIDERVLEFGWNDIWSGVAFIGIISIALLILNIPLSLYSTFVIEERFGFNKTTYKTYILDTVKSIVLSLVIGLPCLIAILYFFEYTGDYSWLYVWIFISITSLVISIIGPIWIMPIFNKFTPLETGELRDAIVEYAKMVDFKFNNIYVIDGSKRSAHSNAFFTGFGKTKRIALFDTLIDQLDTKEIVSVIAHEVGHSKKKHVLLGISMGIIHTGILLFALSLMLESEMLFDAFFMKNTSIYASIVFFGFLFTPIEMVVSLFMQSISRRNEHEADYWAVSTTTNEINLISGLKKLAQKNLSNLSPHPLYVTLNYSHPPLSRRIESIKEYSKK
tara:strand:+ start:1619 stop:2860 length:1242 start_codon:yes stop_codon:yes gene_type:complete